MGDEESRQGACDGRFEILVVCGHAPAMRKYARHTLSASVKSPASRRCSRRYRPRVVSVQGTVTCIDSSKPTESQPTEITQLFFDQALSKAAS